MFVVFEFDSEVVGSEDWRVVGCFENKQEALDFGAAHPKPRHSPVVVVDGPHFERVEQVARFLGVDPKNVIPGSGRFIEKFDALDASVRPPFFPISWRAEPC